MIYLILFERACSPTVTRTTVELGINLERVTANPELTYDAKKAVLPPSRSQMAQIGRFGIFVLMLRRQTGSQS